MGYRRPSHREEYFHKREYAYDPQTDGYRCPAGQIIVYHGTNRTGYREYASDPGQCRQCPQRARCTQSQNTQKLLTRNLSEFLCLRHNVIPERKSYAKKEIETAPAAGCGVAGRGQAMA